MVGLSEQGRHPLAADGRRYCFQSIFGKFPRAIIVRRVDDRDATMEKLLPYYERELGTFRRSCREFAERYPRIANELLMAGEACKDPHIERMIQSFALLTARISKRLDDDYPQFTESLLEALYPHYLRAFPSASIARIDAEGTGRDAAIPRGTAMHSAPVQGVRCQFRSAYDVAVAPLAITQARFEALIGAPTAIRLAPGVSSSISIAIDSTGLDSLDQLAPQRLRVFLDGEPSFCAALRDTLFMRACGAYVCSAGDGAWNELDAVPIEAVGFAEEDALIPYTARSHPAYRLLTEYFAFPEKFNFFDLDLGRIVPLLPKECSRFTLHLALKNIRADSNLARSLASLKPANLQLNCTPAVNLFQCGAVPVAITGTAPDYALLADAAHAHAYEIHTVESALLVSGTGQATSVKQLHPFYSTRHGQGDANDYWITRRDELVADCSPGHEVRIALVDGELEALPAEARTLSAQLTCSNRDLPASLSYGLPGGDLDVGGTMGKTMARLLRKPSASLRFDGGRGAHWRLISHLSLNHRALSGLGVEEFRKMLTLYDMAASPVTQRQIRGVLALQYKVIMAWIPGTPCAALMPGIEVRMTLDEEAFTGSGIHAFAQVIDRFLALYGQINVFSQLIVLSKHNGEELLRCPPRSGNQSLA